MNKVILGLVLFVGATVPASAHKHAVQQMNVGTASDLDAWRHYLLLTAASGSKDATVFALATQFKTEWEARILAFNAVQETRTDFTEQTAALEQFVIDRDALVSSYKVQMEKQESVLGAVMLLKSYMQSTNPKVAIAGFSPSYNCPGFVKQANYTCNLTYSVAQYINGITVTGTVPNLSYSSDTLFTVLMDGTQNMQPQPPGVSHYITVGLQHGSWQYHQGVSVCPSCYISSTYTWEFVDNGDGTIQMDDSGVLDCTAIGKVLATTDDGWFYELAHTWGSLTGTPQQSTSGTWSWGPNNEMAPPPTTGYSNTPMSYYKLLNKCGNIPGGHYPDLDLSLNFLVAMPTIYPQGGYLPNGPYIPARGQVNLYLVYLYGVNGVGWGSAGPGIWPIYTTNNNPNQTWNLPLAEVFFNYVSVTNGIPTSSFSCTYHSNESSYSPFNSMAKR